MATPPRSLPVRLLRWVLGAVAVVALLVVGGTFIRATLLMPDAPLALWHTEVPPELDAAALDRSDWAGYVAAENAARAFVATNVTARTPPEARVALNRYYAGSPIHAPGFARDWNRSFVLEPAGQSAGVIVLVHGLTDSPYSLRHVALLYQARGWTAIGLRVPGHGTVPAGLTKATWPQWAAAVRLAMREAARRSAGAPIHIAGYSNGGALVMHYALAAAADPKLPQPARVLLFSPMIGVTEFARFSGIAGWPAIVPGLERAKWLDILPEYNPFKTSSFPVQAAKESFALTEALDRAMSAAVADGSVRRLPPVLAFQSLVDSTVSTRAVVSSLFDRLPTNGSELVIFDINRAATIEPMLRPAVAQRLATLLPPARRKYRVSIVTNVGPETPEVAEVATPAGATAATRRDLGLAFPRGVFSLGHVALPFPLTDGLYGLEPDPAEDFGIQLGALPLRGEQNVLRLGLDTLMRVSFNPFFPYVAARIDAGIPANAGGARPAA